MQFISLQEVASQTLTILLASQLTKLSIYTLADGNLYMDVLVNDVDIITGVLCKNETVIVRDAYLGFVGDLAFVDTQGDSDPVSTGLGSRYQLAYLSADEVAAI